MPINTDLLISAPVLQDYLVDKDGAPMSGGTVTCYHDNSRTTLKNWFYQSGTPGNYTYITLPNPLTLSAAGTIEDVNGVDTIPFFYPYDEDNESIFDPYYITIVNHNGTNQITRANFPFVGNINNESIAVSQLNNLIINNGFWRNIAQNNKSTPPFVSFNLSSFLSMVVAPSQHDSFRYPDIIFFKSNTTATDNVTFLPFPFSNSTPIRNYISPEYYLNHNCSAAGNSENFKYYQFPISAHLNTLANIEFTFSIQARNSGGTAPGQNVISIFILQDTGSGTTSPAPNQIGQITLTNSWTNYTITSIFPSPSGLLLSEGGDDGFYLLVQMPLKTSCSIDFTKPSIYLTTDIIPNNDFQTYDQVDPIINGARTGDIRISINSFYHYGWVPMNDGTIGNSASNATAKSAVDAWPLFNLLWGLFSKYNNGSVNLLAQMYSSTGVPVPYGTSAIADWSNNRAISLTKMMGRVILGAPVRALSNYSTTFTAAANTITTTNNVSFFNGMPVFFTGATNLSNNLIYYVSDFNGTNSFKLANSFQNAITLNTLSFPGGSGTVSSGLPGSYEGEYAHTQLVSELAPHDHTFSVYNPSGFGNRAAATTPVAALTDVTDVRGGGQSFNVTQPGAFYNMFIKL